MGLVLWYWTIFNGTFRDLQTWRLPFSLFLNADSKKYFFIFRFLISLIVPPIPSNTVLLFKKKRNTRIDLHGILERRGKPEGTSI